VNILENSTVALRALEPEDLELLYQWENDTSVWHLSNTLVPYSRYLLKQYLENAGRDIFEHKQLRLIIELIKGGKAIGAIDLFDFDPFHRRAGIGILIADLSQRRKGYARESLETLKEYAFSVLKLHQLYCNIAGGNESSINLFTGAGFRRVGEKRDWLFNGAGYESEWLFQCISPVNQKQGSHPGN